MGQADRTNRAPFQRAALQHPRPTCSFVRTHGPLNPPKTGHKRQSPVRATVHAVGVGEAGEYRKRGNVKRCRNMNTVGAATTASGDLPVAAVAFVWPRWPALAAGALASRSATALPSQAPTSRSKTIIITNDH